MEGLHWITIYAVHYALIFIYDSMSPIISHTIQMQAAAILNLYLRHKEQYLKKEQVIVGYLPLPMLLICALEITLLLTGDKY